MQLTFLPIRLDFNPHTRAVQVVARYEGRNIDVLLSRAAIEDLAGAEDLDKNASFTTVARNKKVLAHAAEIALARFGDDCPAVIVELSHLVLIDSIAATNHCAPACVA